MLLAIVAKFNLLCLEKKTGSDLFLVFKLFWAELFYKTRNLLLKILDLPLILDIDPMRVEANGVAEQLRL